MDEIKIEKIDFDLIGWIKRDYWAIIILLVAILISVYALGQVKAVEQRCNNHWLEEFNAKCYNYQTIEPDDSFINGVDLGQAVNETQVE